METNELKDIATFIFIILLALPAAYSVIRYGIPILLWLMSYLVLLTIIFLTIAVLVR